VTASWLGVYFSPEKFSAIAAVTICQRLAGVKVLGKIDFLEGQRTDIRQTTYERNDEARSACIRHYDSTYCCMICDMNFAQKYGPKLGEKFIHVHHINPISNGGPRKVNPTTDLIPVCPNCHAMLHQETPPIQPAQLRKIIGK
jgi:5-methylcytosine-specific restriction enzyme A